MLCHYMVYRLNWYLKDYSSILVLLEILNPKLLDILSL